MIADSYGFQTLGIACHSLLAELIDRTTASNVRASPQQRPDRPIIGAVRLIDGRIISETRDGKSFRTRN